MTPNIGERDAMAVDPIDLGELGARVAEHRRRFSLSLRAAADQAEVPFNTLARVEKGKLPDLANFKRIVEWLGLDPALFFAPPRTRQESTVEAIQSLLRRDSNLSDQATVHIGGLVESLYTALASPPDDVVMHIHVAPTLVPTAANLLGDLITAMQAKLVEQSVAPGWSS